MRSTNSISLRDAASYSELSVSSSASRFLATAFIAVTIEILPENNGANLFTSTEFAEAYRAGQVSAAPQMIAELREVMSAGLSGVPGNGLCEAGERCDLRSGVSTTSCVPQDCPFPLTQCPTAVALVDEGMWHVLDG